MPEEDRLTVTPPMKKGIALRSLFYCSNPAYFAVIKATVVSSMRLLKQKETASGLFFRRCASTHSLWLRPTLQVTLRRNEWGSGPAYFAVIKATVVSSMRLLKPHSLSYHDETLTRRPETLVSVASKFDDAGLWL